MKYLKQFGWIMMVTCVGEIVKFYIPLPIPASIYGMGIMMFLLMNKIIKLDEVKEVGTFLVEIMPVMFIPAGVGILVSWSQLREMLVPVMIIVVVSTILVMVISGRVTQQLMKED